MSFIKLEAVGKIYQSGEMVVPALKNGTFVDMGIEYSPGKKPRKIGVETLVLGDIHWGDHDETSIKANYEMIDYFKISDDEQLQKIPSGKQYIYYNNHYVYTENGKVTSWQKF